MKTRISIALMCVCAFVVFFGVGAAWAKKQDTARKKTSIQDQIAKKLKKVTPLERQAAAGRFHTTQEAALAAGALMTAPMLDPGGVPHYFGPYPNYANSALPTGPVTSITVDSGGSGYTAPVVEITDLYTGATTTPAEATAVVTNGVISSITLSTGGSGYMRPVVSITDATGTGAAATAVIGGPLTGGIRKFVDQLPNIPAAVPDTITYPGSDYYEIAVREYSQKMHSDVPLTKLRGYVQINNGTDPATGQNTITPAGIQYLGPTIVAQRDRPVRVKFINQLPTGAAGNLFLPVDKTTMGAGMGPNAAMTGKADEMCAMDPSACYTENRATVHLHGNNSVWISDGTPHQWITPAGENTPYPKGVSVVNVPDMPDPGDGSMTFFYTNSQSARLMFYHDHAFGITRLNVYAGEAAGYLLTDQAEQQLIGSGLLPDLGIPLIIQDKTFVDASTIAYQDPTWKWGTTPPVPNSGDLWYPHVYMPNQNPWDIGGMNAFGRWHYAPWFWPPATNLTYPPIANPYYQPDPALPNYAPWEPPMIPDMPNPSSAAEAFMDTPVVNGMAYPYLEVEPKAYRFRILNAADDRFFNLQLYVADPTVTTIDNRTNTEVAMISASSCPTGTLPAGWPTDGREGGVPDPAAAGPAFVQIGNEGGFLPSPVVISNLPIGWNLDQTNFDFGVVNQGTLILGTAERADVMIDFSQYAGKTLILYNDAPAPFPAIDPRYDYYTNNPDMTDAGGTPPTIAGYGPNTRTIMQIRVGTSVTTPSTLDLAGLNAAFASSPTGTGVFKASQDEIIIPSDAYNSAYNAAFPADPYVRIYETSKMFSTVSGVQVTIPLQPKAIQDEMGEAFDTDYGRMSAMLGLELPNTQAGAANFILYPYVSPPVEIVKGMIYGTPLGSAEDGTQFWKITHNGVDTHTVHVHLYNAQLVNRVAWDNALRLPDLNELGWKETFRVNPLQDTIIAFRPIIPQNLPFKVPNSVRAIDPTMPLGEPLKAPLGGFKDPNGEPVSILNHLVNYGWEYVYHCHLLAHEEMDMMHSVAVALPPDAPSGLSAVRQGGNMVLSWTDNSINETGFTIERAENASFTVAVAYFRPGANATTYTDSTVRNNRTYYYRIAGNNMVGDAGTTGFPVTTVNSGFSNTAPYPANAPLTAPAAPSGVSATAALQGNNARVTLTWTDSSNNEAGFRIQRATNAEFTAGLNTTTVGVNATTYTTGNLPRNTNFYFRVLSYNSADPSAWVNATPFPIATP